MSEFEKLLDTLLGITFEQDMPIDKYEATIDEYYALKTAVLAAYEQKCKELEGAREAFMAFKKRFEPFVAVAPYDIVRKFGPEYSLLKEAFGLLYEEEP